MDVPDMDILPPLVGGRCPPERFERPQNHRARGTCLQARCWVREHALSASGTQVPTANHWPRARRMRCGRAAPQIGPIRKWRVPRRFLVNRVAGPTGGMFSPPLTMETSRSLATVGQALRPVIHSSNTLHAIVRRELMGSSVCKQQPLPLVRRRPPNRRGPFDIERQDACPTHVRHRPTFGSRLDDRGPFYDGSSAQQLHPSSCHTSCKSLPLLSN